MDIVFDLDGTICFQGKPIAKEISEKLKTLQERGHRVLIASARPIRDIYPVLPEWMRSLDMVGGNGAFVQKNGKVEVVSIDCMDQLKELIDKYRLSYLADSRWDYAYTGPRDHPILANVDPGRLAQNKLTLDELEEIAKLILFTDDEQIVEQLKQLPVQLYNHTGEPLIDISPLDVHKWSGLQKLDVTDGEFIAFGNDMNDIEMFRHAKYSVCIGNHPLASECATKSIAIAEIGYEIDAIIQATDSEC